MPYTLCHHVRQNRTICQSPALKGTSFCHTHYRLNKRKSSILTTSRLPAIAELPRSTELAFAIENINGRESLLITISQVIAALAADQISRERASAMLYGLQLASSRM